MTQRFRLKILQACPLFFQPRSDRSGKWGNGTPLSGPRVLLLALALSSCGGGGGSSTPALSLSALLPWTWIGGSSTPNQSSTATTPGARISSATWTDSSGNFWMFGGEISSTSDTNDLWVYNPVTHTWTQESAPSSLNLPGAYGTQGTPGTGNLPGARNDSVSWIDLSGNLWLFGGYGYASSSTLGDMNDLWEYVPTNKTWTWVGGSNQINQSGSYGGNPGTTGTPGSRLASVSWTDSTGNLWLFGGKGYASSGSTGELNDLWKYAPSAKTWTWVSGSSSPNQLSMGTSPGARHDSVAWIDSTGNLWLFGGVGYGPTNTLGELNDLWKFNLGTQQWTWVNGSNQVNQLGSYGSQPGTRGMPGARSSANAWFSSGIGTSGSLWLFGGLEGAGNYLNDLWQYTP